jgi:dolichol-phosphate mannosyltransferase
MWSSLSIVMAAYNEEEALPACVERTLSFLREHVTDGELIIVNDGSNDGTANVIDDLAAANPEISGRHLAQNSGMGAALLDGYNVATRDWVTMLPADGQLDAYDLLGFFPATDDAVLVTSLYRNREYNLHRKVLSLGLRVLTTIIVGTRARTEGTYLVRRDILESLGANSKSFLLNLEIPIRAKRGGHPVATVYMNVHERIAGVSKATAARRIIQTFEELFRLRIRMEKERLRRIFGTSR